jgi:hypothetical protein
MATREDYKSPLEPDWDQLNIPVKDGVEPEDCEPSHTKGEDEDGS